MTADNTSLLFFQFDVCKMVKQKVAQFKMEQEERDGGFMGGLEDDISSDGCSPHPHRPVDAPLFDSLL